ncbi:AbrB/MazE/SpoVT family DNA-binding domain-containing protein [Vitreimonas flagellata]|uniref:AbrB/MazE/SpoVT family DNA-binding domain-containing protein n=1 Tax=Vitreimonas flagellata TaxID=2560861 RepID=UPI001074A002|nr:AbrB/MazE/SpoVT family DNA-binding domain-containing protein [Vitreimonas flagellata]
MRAKIRSRARVTLPHDVRDVLQVTEGDYLRFIQTEDGAFIMRAEKSALLGLRLQTKPTLDRD